MFGTFDKLDSEHYKFISRAREFSEKLVVSLAKDEHVKRYKDKHPAENQETRKQKLEQLDEIDKVFFSDDVDGAFHIVDELKPDIVILGYDQSDLLYAIREWMSENFYVTTLILRHYEADQRN